MNKLTMHLSVFKRQVKKLTDLRNILIVNVLCLCVNLFLIVMQINQGFWPPESFFPQSLTQHDQVVMFRTLKALTDVCDKHNLTYFLYAGSMLGSYRHHGVIPWDDDVDIMFNGTEKAKVQKILGSMEPDYSLYSQSPQHYHTYGTWKFYSNKAESFVHRPFAWPYMDIFFFRENETHIWDEIPKYGDAFTKRKEFIFPLTKRPFGSMEVNAPCDIEMAMHRLFDPVMCQSPSFNHMAEIPAFSFNKKLIPCSQLAGKFPFVSHKRLADGSYNETLSIAGWALADRHVHRCRNPSRVR